MATDIEKVFEEFASNLEISDKQESLVSDRRANVVKALKEELTLHTEESKVTGSWDRNTLTRYLFEGDVDVMVILHYGKNKEWENAEGTIKALDRFKDILDEAYEDTPKRRDENCISMQFSEFRLDVVPAFKYEDGYYTIPDTVRKLWVKTNPFEFADKITEVNKTMGGTFVPLIKMVKGWNREVGWPIRSFHLECMMYHRYSTYTQGYTYSSMVKVFFENLANYLSKPCYDPVMGDRVDTYLDNDATKTKRTIAIEKAKKAAAAAKEAYDDQEKYPTLAPDEWKALMGEFFPSK
jgi:Second Messenger Oligonucleotide or Dinucleotide Synthetase domain